MTVWHVRPAGSFLLWVFAAVLAVAATAGLSSRLPLLALVELISAPFAALLLVLWRPWIALAIGAAAPFIPPAYGSWLLVPGSVGLLLVVIATCWSAAGPQARRGARLIAVTGLATLVIGVGFASSPTAGGGGVALAVAHATAVGAAAAIVGPDASMVALGVAVVGSVAGLMAIATPALRVIRASVVLGENANGIGLLTAIGLVAGLILVRRWTTLLGLAGLAAAIICTLGLLASGSRGGLVTALAGGSVLILHRAFQARPAKAIPAGAGLIGLLYLISPPLVAIFVNAVGRDQLDAESSTLSRESALSYAIHQGVAHPLFGVGLGQLSNTSMYDPASGLGLRAHNVFAGVFAETGTLTLLALSAVSLLALLRARAYAARSLLPLVVAVLVSSASVEWWGAGRTGPIVLLVLGAAVGLGGRAWASQAHPGPPPAIPAPTMQGDHFTPRAREA